MLQESGKSWMLRESRIGKTLTVNLPGVGTFHVAFDHEPVEGEKIRLQASNAKGQHLQSDYTFTQAGGLARPEETERKAEDEHLQKVGDFFKQNPSNMKALREVAPFFYKYDSSDAETVKTKFDGENFTISFNAAYDRGALKTVTVPKAKMEEWFRRDEEFRKTGVPHP